MVWLIVIAALQLLVLGYIALRVEQLLTTKTFCDMMMAVVSDLKRG